MKRESPMLLQPPASTPAVESFVPVISVVTCPHQQERSLEQAIRSVLDKLLWTVARRRRLVAEDGAGARVARGRADDLAWLERKVVKGDAR